jgi:hypothetical protein
MAPLRAIAIILGREIALTSVLEQRGGHVMKVYRGRDAVMDRPIVQMLLGPNV